MAIEDDILGLFAILYSDLNPVEEFFNKKPLLAHYTSPEVLQSIVTNNEIWFSNPLFMNDLEEIRFGVLGGVNAARANGNLRSALGERAQQQSFYASLDHYFKEFEDNHAFDTYVFCASEHRPDNDDGVLSMWRGYGGNGKGTAIVFDTGQINVATGITPLVISAVKYATSEQRQQRLTEYCDSAASVIAQQKIADDKMYLASYALFERIKLFALFTKHTGFHEENEWRIVYRHEFDRVKLYEKIFGYNIGVRGVEPKSKFKVLPLLGATAEDLSLEKIINKIILGPTTSSVLARKSVERMLGLLGRPLLADRVVASTIPLRPE